MIWEATHALVGEGLSPEIVWDAAYAEPSLWLRWNDALASAKLLGPVEVGSCAKVRFRTGLRLRFHFTEVEHSRLFTDEAHLPGARMGHRHEIQAADRDVKITNTIYITGRLAWLWSRILGPSAQRGLPGWQQRILELAREATAASAQ